MAVRAKGWVQVEGVEVGGELGVGGGAGEGKLKLVVGRGRIGRERRR